MDQETKKKLREDAYNKKVKEVTPTHNLWMNMAKAFLVGGIICTVGQVILNILLNYKVPEKEAYSWTGVILIFISVILTGLNVYPSLANFGGAGALVPITGFANGVASCAIEYKKEGQVFGIGSKIFSIAGPVILYGIVTSFIAAFIYWMYKVLW